MEKKQFITPADLAEELRRHVGEGGGGQWAARYGVDRGFLSKMCNGLVPIPDRIANILGYQKDVSTTYKRIDGRNEEA